MLPGSLFIKLFLWFWLAMLAIGATFLVLGHYWNPATGLPDADDMRDYAEEIQRLHQDEGMGAAAGYLRALGRRQDVRFALIREDDGRGQFGRGVPPSLRAALMHAGHHADGSARREEGVRFRAVPLELNDGIPRVLVAVRPVQGLGDVPGWLRLVIALGVTAGLSVLFASHLSAPVRRVREATRRFAAGELSVRVPEPGGRGDEITALGRDFNTMADRLQAAMEVRNQLLRDISHELRSPLARMQVALELSRRQFGKGADASLDRMEREIERLDALIGEVLALSRLESGAVPLQRDLFDMRALLAQVCEDAAFEARASGRDVVFDGGCEVQLEGDRALLRSALDNVIRNAVRHTAEDTRVDVGCAATEGWLNIIVADQGAGVPEHRISDIFEPFVRASDARERESGGHGLGLAIARRAVQAHGGSISAANRAAGGLMVRISIPASALART
ncbi:MAG: ATP-binding protein [Aquisalimonadaceae bacterium]